MLPGWYVTLWPNTGRGEVRSKIDERHFGYMRTQEDACVEREGCGKIRGPGGHSIRLALLSVPPSLPRPCFLPATSPSFVFAFYWDNFLCAVQVGFKLRVLCPSFSCSRTCARPVGDLCSPLFSSFPREVRIRQFAFTKKFCSLDQKD